MPCFHPLTGYRARKPGPSGKTAIVFKKEDSSGVEVTLPCGQCIGCRLERSRQWAVRIMHEASLHTQNVFLTLTYDDSHVPRDYSLDKSHFQKFCKRLRHHCGPFRFFHAGEYGERFRRPHYHACVFGLDFEDKVFYKVAADGSRLYTSELLNSVWQLGGCVIGDVTFESAAYVARYILKKVTGKDSQDAYLIFNPETGEVPVDSDGKSYCREPEYVTMSRRPGIGACWFSRFSTDVYPSDEVIVRGHSCRPPKYYDHLYELDGGDLDSLKSLRRANSARFACNNTEERLRVREIVTRARVSFLKRTVE